MATFFTVMEVEECVTHLQKVAEFNIEEREIVDSIGYVLASDIYANEDIPQAIRSCMDGYAVRSTDTMGASEHNPAYIECIGSIRVDEISDIEIQQGQCVEIVTGAILPQGADAVVMVEYTHTLGEGTIAIGKSVPPQEHCMLKGEDAQAGVIALSKGTLIRAQEVALLATLGVSHISVYKKPRVSIFSTGDEIIEIDQALQVGLVRDANSYSVEAMLRSLGCYTIHLPIVNDSVEMLKAHLEKALLESDIVLLSGGSSIGARDCTIEAMESLGDIEIITHGLAMQPGKPTIVAKRGNQYIIGLPGQMASAYCVLVALVVPFIHYYSGRKDAFDRITWDYRSAILTRNIAGAPGRETWVRVRLVEQEGLYYATPVLGKSGLLRTLVATSGVIVIPSYSEGIEEGTSVRVYSL